MAEAEWEVQAIREQFAVLKNLIPPYTTLSTDVLNLKHRVTSIKNKYLRTNTPSKSPRELSGEIIRQTDDSSPITLSFVVIVTDINVQGSLCKMPVFVIVSGNKKIYLDVNCTVFNSWQAFLKMNDLPSCQICFPVGGQYGGKLKVDFGKSPVAARESPARYLRWFGIIAGVGAIAASFFFKIPPTAHTYVDSLMKLAGEFAPTIEKYRTAVTSAMKSIQDFRSMKIDKLAFLRQICLTLKYLHKEFSEEINDFFQRVRKTLQSVYAWIKRLFSRFSCSASESSNQSSEHQFLATTLRVDTKLNIVDREVEEILEASRTNARLTKTGQLDPHSQAEDDDCYVNNIFRNSQNESALQRENKINENEKLSQRTMQMLITSAKVADRLGSDSLKEAQDVFEALTSIVEDEFKHNIDTYTKMTKAAQVAAGYEIDLNTFNRALGIEGDPKEYYWTQSLKSVVQPRLAHRVKEKIKELEKIKNITLIEVWKKDYVEGLYRSVGVNGAGKYTTNDLIKALKKMPVSLDENMLVIDESESMIIIRAEDLSVAAYQDLTSDNTAEGMVLIQRSSF